MTVLAIIFSLWPNVNFISWIYIVMILLERRVLIMEVETCRVRIQWLGVEIIKPPFGNYIFFLTATVNDGPSYTFRHPVKATEIVPIPIDPGLPFTIPVGQSTTLAVPEKARIRVDFDANAIKKSPSLIASDGSHFVEANCPVTPIEFPVTVRDNEIEARFIIRMTIIDP